MIETRAHTVGPAWQKETGWIRTVGPIYDFAQKSAPCRQSCPAGHDISWALNLVRNEDFKGALALFREDSPFPSITGRVCYHPCESKCNRGDHDQPLAINALERAMSHYADAPAIPQNPTHSETVAVVGSGPAGLTAAYHLVLLGYPVTVIEKHPKLGGALRYGIPEYRLPSEILDQEIGRLTTLGVQFQPDTNIGVDLAWTELRGDYDAVFLGIGLSQGTALRTPGIESVTARSGLEFLHEVNRVEISQLDGEVLVIGSGDVAMDVARSARRLGALGVHVASLEKRSEMTCHPAELSEALEEGVRLHDEWSATHIAPTDDGRIRVEFANVTAIKDGFVPVVGDQTMEMVVDHFLYAIGQTPVAEFLPEEIFGPDGRVAVDAAGRTAVDGVFAGGDIAGSYNVVQAIGAGKKAAVGIDCHLRGYDPEPLLAQSTVGGRGAISMRRYRQVLAQMDDSDDGSDDGVKSDPISKERTRLTGSDGAVDVIPFANINLDYFPQVKRTSSSNLRPERRRGFEEVKHVFDRQTAIAEASRCFHCGECTMCGNCFDFCPDSAVVQKGDQGFFVIDSAHCKGCGTCVTECPRSAMSMVPEQEFAKWTR